MGSSDVYTVGQCFAAEVWRERDGERFESLQRWADVNSGARLGIGGVMILV